MQGVEKQIPPLNGRTESHYKGTYALGGEEERESVKVLVAQL